MGVQEEERRRTRGWASSNRRRRRSSSNSRKGEWGRRSMWMEGGEGRRREIQISNFEIVAPSFDGLESERWWAPMWAELWA